MRTRVEALSSEVREAGSLPWGLHVSRVRPEPAAALRPRYRSGGWFPGVRRRREPRPHPAGGARTPDRGRTGSRSGGSSSWFPGCATRKRPAPRSRAAGCAAFGQGPGSGFGYRQKLSELKGVDFDDLLIRTLELLDASETARSFVARRVRHLLIDEYQDTGPTQHRLVLKLAPHRDVFAVGDDDQAIYSFRGARFSKHSSASGRTSRGPGSCAWRRTTAPPPPSSMPPMR